MVVKIPINRGKTASEEAVLESPGTNTTKVTNENDTPCKFGAAAAKKKRKKSNQSSFASNTNEGDVGDNSSISSRSSMNSVLSNDQSARDNIRIEGETLSTTYAATANATAAASTRPHSSSEEYAVTISSPSDHSREQIDHPFPSPDTLLIGVSVIFFLEP
jgi:hypothetical protein